ncbi:unnamed protein product [Auanema sp. JU1783]|nr:unnamed protein product [Auanema sp. JU1783]
MTEAEKKSFFELAIARAPGKRQIKPTAAVLDLVIPADEDDDEDFVGETGSGSEGSGSGSSSEDSDSEGGEEGQEEEDEETAEVENELAELNEDSTLPVVDLLNTSQESIQGADRICALCFNIKSSAGDDIIICDRCGVAVHESCYLPDIVDDASSSCSSASTEPWFCEPCTYGLVEPPNCEFCPDRHGAFKRSDIGGRWVHLICALYTRGVTFGDIDHLSAVSWQEMDHRNFGRKSCNACTDKLEARVGVATRCELGLCKNHYHITCAQKLGLLVDLSEAEHVDEAHAVEPRYISCKKHSNSDTIKAKRAAYLKWYVQEERRLLGIRRRILNEREEEQRLKALEKFEKENKALIGITICWPGANFDPVDKRARRSRHLHTSARYLEAFREKAELAHVEKNDFDQEFFRVKGDMLPFLYPGFSQHFVEYFNNREDKVFDTEQKRLDEAKFGVEHLKKKQDTLMTQFKKLEKEYQENHANAISAKQLIHKIHTAFKDLGVPELPTIPDHLMLESPKKTKASKSGEAKPTLHSCNECKNNNNQHKLIHCDGCKFWIHLSCLDPPLEKMPKKTNYSWFCSRCCESSDGDHSGLLDEEDSVDGISSRRLRQRSEVKRNRKYDHSPISYSSSSKKKGKRLSETNQSPEVRQTQKRKSVDVEERTKRPRVSSTKKVNVSITENIPEDAPTEVNEEENKEKSKDENIPDPEDFVAKET